VFVSTDQGFSLGHDPRKHDAWEGVVVARWRRDAIDRLLWEHLDRPAAYLYRYDASGRGRPLAVTPFVPPPTLRVEGESLYPPEHLQGGFAHPEVRQLPCVSGQRVLRFRPAGRDPVFVTLSVPKTRADAGSILLGWSDDASGPVEVEVRISGQPRPIDWGESTGKRRAPGVGSPCRLGRFSLPAGLTGPVIPLELGATGGSLDYIEPAGGDELGIPGSRD
jgi:hypothetical protein